MNKKESSNDHQMVLDLYGEPLHVKEGILRGLDTDQLHRLETECTKFLQEINSIKRLIG